MNVSYLLENELHTINLDAQGQWSSQIILNLKDSRARNSDILELNRNDKRCVITLYNQSRTVVFIAEITIATSK